MKYLVTGGAGFVGSNIVAALVEKGHEVSVLDDYSLGCDDNLARVKDDISIVKGDIRDLELVKKLSKGVDFICHQAAASSTIMFINDLRNALSVNLDGLLNVLTAAMDNDVKRVVYASSSTVYGNSPIPFRETMNPAPGNFYASSKLCGEHLAGSYSNVHGLETVGLRYMGIYGPGELQKGLAASVVTQFLFHMQKDEQPDVYEDGKQTRDLVYVKDVVQANLRAIECEEKLLGEVFNVGTGQRTSFNELVAELNKALGKDIKPVYMPVPYAGYQLNQLGDISLIESRLGYRPQYNLEKGIEDTLRFYREN